MGRVLDVPIMVRLLSLHAHTMTPSQDWRTKVMLAVGEVSGREPTMSESEFLAIIESLITAAEQRGRVEAVEYIEKNASYDLEEKFRFVSDDLLEAARSNSKVWK